MFVFAGFSLIVSILVSLFDIVCLMRDIAYIFTRKISLLLFHLGAPMVETWKTCAMLPPDYSSLYWFNFLQLIIYKAERVGRKDCSVCYMASYQMKIQKFQAVKKLIRLTSLRDNVRSEAWRPNHTYCQNVLQSFGIS